MAGKLTISTLNDSSGVLATQNGMTGIAKAWVNFAGSSGTIAGGFNVSSITRTATGNYTINFTTAMPNANYVVCGTAQNNGAGTAAIVPNGGSGSASVLTTTTAPIALWTTQGSGVYDSTVVCVAFFGA